MSTSSRSPDGYRSALLMMVPAAVLALGAVWPPAGLAIPVLVILAALGARYRRRWFCSRACPRGALLSGILRRLSRMKPLPKALRSPGIRTLSCAFLMVCAVGQTVRLKADPTALGRFFWAVCASTLALSVVLGWIWKPRAWCAVCPVGALQDAVTDRTKASGVDIKE